MGRYLYLVLQRYIIRVDLSKNDSRLEKFVDFLHHNLFLGMGAFSDDSKKLYVVGGEKVKDNSTHLLLVKCESVLDFSDGGDALNPRVYVFDHDNNRFSPDPKIPPMIAGKTKPVVTMVAGKIYVLSSTPYFGKKVPSPAFECCDPSNELCCLWEELPEPPFYQDPDTRMRASSITHHFVLDNKIYVINSLGVYYYDTDYRVWKNDYDSNKKSAFRSGCFAQGEDGIVIGFTEEEGLVVYYYDEQRILKCHEVLENLNANFIFPGNPVRFIRHLGNNKFCFVLAEGRPRYLAAPFHVSIFKVTMHISLEDGKVFFNTKLVSRRCYFNPMITNREDRIIRDIFII